MKDLKHLYFELLEYLSDYGIGIAANVKDLCSNYAIREINDENISVDEAFSIFGKRWSKVMSVLESIQKIGYIKYSSEHGDLSQLLIVGGNFSVSITKEGLDYYYTHALRKATLISYKNQKWVNRITWLISCISIGIAVFFGLKSDSLGTQVRELQKRVSALEKAAVKPIYYTPKLADTILRHSPPKNSVKH